MVNSHPGYTILSDSYDLCTWFTCGHDVCVSLRGSRELGTGSLTVASDDVTWFYLNDTQIPKS